MRTDTEVIDLRHRSGEMVLGVGTQADRYLQIEADIFNLDPIRFEATVQLSVRPSGALRGQRAAVPNADIVLTVVSGEIVQDFVFPANTLINTQDIRVELTEGSIQHYPFDRYTTTIAWSAHLATETGHGAAIPIRLSAYSTTPGFGIHFQDGALSPAARDRSEVALEVDAPRSVLIRWFAAMLYASMFVVGVGALVVGGLMLLRIRRVEPPLLGALAGMMFAVPVLRNTLPGSPPIGVTSDLVVFLWSEIAVVVGLALGIISWARFGNKPGS